MSFLALFYENHLFLADSQKSMNRFYDCMEYENTITQIDEDLPETRKRSQCDGNRYNIVQGVYEMLSFEEANEFLNQREGNVTSVYRLDDSVLLYPFPNVVSFYNYGGKNPMDETYIANMVRMFPSLEILDVSDTDLSSVSVRTIASCLLKLKELRIYQVDADLTPVQTLNHLQTLKYTSGRVPLNFTRPVPSLEVLYIDSIDYFLNNSNIIELCKNTPNLKSLTFDGCACDSRIFKYFLGTVPHLQKLAITNFGYDCSHTTKIINDRYDMMWQPSASFSCEPSDLRAKIMSAPSEQNLMEVLKQAYNGPEIQLFFKSKVRDYGIDNAQEYSHSNYEHDNIRRLTDSEYIFQMVNHMFYS